MNRQQRRAQKHLKAKGQTPAPLSVQSAPNPYAMEVEKARQLLKIGDILNASTLLTNILKKQPDNIDAIEFMGVAAMKLRKYDVALNFFETAKQLAPAQHIKWNAYIGCIYGETERFEEAIPLLEQAYDAIGVPEFQSLLASAYFQTGAFEKGKKHLEKAMAEDPDKPFYLFMYVNNVHKVASMDDPFMQKLLAMEGELAQHSQEDQANLYYTLFKVYNDLKEYETAFKHVLKGAEMKRATFTLNASKTENLFEHIKAFFSKEFIETYAPEKQCLSKKPIFILAMPRSGTTLLEQILSAHSQIEAIGEDSYAFDLVRMYSHIPPYGDVPYPLGNVNDPQKRLSPYQVGQQYVEYITEKRPQADFVVNKAIGSFFHAGFLKLALPHAKFIHMNRNPMDSCLSTFTQLFAGYAQSYSYDLAELGARYIAYMQMMEHWYSVMPEDILSVDYEDLVQDPENQARRILDFIGVEWDPECLQYHEKDSVVKTASIKQVRKPIYTSSIDRWKRYGPEIAPLIEALGDYAPKEAQDYLNKIKKG